jgi:hypothetical protein
MELEVFFTIIQQTYSKLVISFMNRKSSCGYSTHFLINNAIYDFSDKTILLQIYTAQWWQFHFLNNKKNSENSAKQFLSWKSGII